MKIKMGNIDNYKYKWRYADEERPTIAECYDCGREYGTFCDLSIPNELWEMINPTFHKGCGILCPNCMADRLDYLGLWYDYCSDAIYFQSYSYIKFRRWLFNHITRLINYPIKYWIYSITHRN